MAATADQIAELRRMVAESGVDSTYSSELLSDYIEKYPCLDERGEVPYTWDTATEPPTQKDNDDWIPTYDLAAAAADVWSEKAAVLAGDFDFSADGASYSRSQAYKQAMTQARYWRSRRKPSSHYAVMHPKPSTAARRPWVGNLPEED